MDTREKENRPRQDNRGGQVMTILECSQYKAGATDTQGEPPSNIVRVVSSAPRFKLTAFGDIKLGSAPFYLIKGIIPRIGLAVIWGPPKCGKSFVVFDMMMHVARGLDYRNRRVQQGPVVYCALEGASGFKARIEAYRMQNMPDGDDECPFYLMDAPLRLVADEAALIASIKYQLGNQVSPAAITIDTVNRSFVGSESDDKDMAAYLRSADALRDAFGCVVILIHHCGINDSRPRGHTSLTGNADAQISVKRDAAMNIVASVEYLKDGEEGESFISRLESVEVGKDDEGDAITSCVVLPVIESSCSRSVPARKLSDRQKLALNALSNCAADRGNPPPASFGLPKGLCAISVDEWRDELLRTGVLDREAANPRADFKRIRDALQARHLIAERDGLTWRIS